MYPEFGSARDAGILSISISFCLSTRVGSIVSLLGYGPDVSVADRVAIGSVSLPVQVFFVLCPTHWKGPASKSSFIYEGGRHTLNDHFSLVYLCCMVVGSTVLS